MPLYLCSGAAVPVDIPVGKKMMKNVKNAEKSITNEYKNIIFSNLSLGSPKQPSGDQATKFKVPNIDLKISDNKIIITVELPGCKSDNLELSMNQNSLIIKCMNNKDKYYTEIKLPEEIIPQSTIANFKNNSLIVKADITDKAQTWDDLNKIEVLSEDLENFKNKLNKTQEQYHCVQLDYQNLLVKNKKEIESRIDNFKISVIEKLLRNIDNFELALKSTEKVKNKDSEKILVGLKLILNELRNTIIEEGVEEILSEGLIFNPSVHEVVECMETDKHPENTILEEYQKGYKYKNWIIRPSRVKVAVIPKKKVKDKDKGK
jgi:molecular chaperone GrpE